MYANDQTLFGWTPDGHRVDRYRLRSDCLELFVCTLGARVIDLVLTDLRGEKVSVVLGYAALGHYFADDAYLGAIVGRYANRISNAGFSIDNRHYTVTRNDGPNALHGGVHGFDERLWEAALDETGVTFMYTSLDGEEGFPGSVTAHVRYSVSGSDMRVDYTVRTSELTPVNLTNHMYFNLTGDPRASIVNHRLKIYANRYTPVNELLIPTGELRTVNQSAFDFRESRRIGERIDAAEQQLEFGGGYDHNWVLEGEVGALRPAAEVYEPISGRTLQVHTTEPGLQFYSGNQLYGPSGNELAPRHLRRCGLCLETQHFPDSPNHPDFPSTLRPPNETYHSTTIYRFSTRWSAQSSAMLEP